MPNKNDTKEISLEIPKPKFTLVKKQDLPEKKEPDRIIYDSTLKAKLLLENFNSEHSYTFFRIALKEWLEETDEMRKIRDEIINKMKNWEEYKNIYSKYENLVKDSKTSTGLNLPLIKAIINLEWWNINEFKENMNDVIDYAWDMNNNKWDAIVNIIDPLVKIILGIK